MQKKLFTLGMLIIFWGAFTHISAQASKLITKIDDTKIKVYHNALVPKNQTFYVYGTNGKLKSTYRSGSYVKLVTGRGGRFDRGAAAKPLDCVKIPCPGTFRPNVTCWECHATPQKVAQ